MLPILTHEQIAELIRDSNGRPVSFCDAPEWYCGTRKTTHIARDGQTEVEYMGCGTAHSLAYSLRDQCAEYLRCADYARESASRVECRKAEIRAEEAKKRPRKRLLADLWQEMTWAQQDIDRSKKRMEEIRAKYFRGFEGRLLVGEQGNAE